MDISIAIELLVPNAEYFGSLTTNTKEAFDALTWNDTRDKPTWSQVEAQDANVTKFTNEANFNVDKMLGAMGLAFTGADAVSLSPYLSAIQNYASSPFRNFKGIKDFLAGLVALGKATQDQANTITAIFAQQGIDLSSYS